MIPGRTKASLTRFFRDQGAWWCRQVEIVVSDGSRSYQAAISQYLPDALHVLDRFHVARWFTEGLALVRREIQRRPPEQRPPTYEPDLFRARFTLLHLADHLNDAHQAAPRPAVRRSSPSPNRVGRAPRALPAVKKKYWPTTPADGHPTDPSKGSTTSSRSYDESLTGSLTTTTTQPEEFS